MQLVNSTSSSHKMVGPVSGKHHYEKTGDDIRVYQYSRTNPYTKVQERVNVAYIFNWATCDWDKAVSSEVIH